MFVNEIINANAIIAEDDENKSIILVGDDIGRKQEVGEPVNLNETIKVIKMADEDDRERFVELLKYASEEDFELSSVIIKEAEKQLGKRLNQKIYLTLTDHLIFALERTRRGISFNNQLLGDLKEYFPKEILIGKKALQIIQDVKNIKMPEDEAGYIALHIANAQGDQCVPLVETKTEALNQIIKIVEADQKIKLDEKTKKFARFVLDLKFTVNRVFSGEMFNDADEVFFEKIKSEYPKAYNTALKVFHFLLNDYSLILTNDELINLTVNINQVIS